jgi:hypothetical protein
MQEAAATLPAPASISTLTARALDIAADPLKPDDMYYVVGKYANGWPMYRSKRGTNKQESAHRQYGRMPGTHMGLESGQVSVMSKISR